MTSRTPSTLLEVEGTLGEVLPRVLREAMPAILEQYRKAPVRMVVTTLMGAARRDAAARGNFFRPARQGQPAEFTWKAAGPLHVVLRQFRLDFLRHLGREEMRCFIGVAIYSTAAQDEASAQPLPAGGPGGRGELWPSGPLGPSAPVTSALSPPPRPIRSSPALAARATGDGALPLEDPLGELTTPRSAPRSARVIEAFAAAPPPLPVRAGEPDAKSRPRVFAGTSARSLPGNLYQEFFGFEQMPFNNTPDTHFYFPSQKHQEALSRLIYAVSERKGFVMISGEIGSGKSTLCRALLAQLPREVKTALITQTHLDATQLVMAIADDLGLPTAGLSRYEALQRVNEYLIEQLAQGCTVCLIIDEAQNLPAEALEEVRMISNLETEKEKLVQLILLGQPNLRDKIMLPQLKQLRQRISVQYHLLPLSRSETMQYIDHRLRIANPTEKVDFPRRTKKEAYAYSGGVPRLINTLCDNALLTAFIRQRRRVTPAMIEEAARDLALEPRAMGLVDFLKFW